MGRCLLLFFVSVALLLAPAQKQTGILAQAARDPLSSRATSAAAYAVIDLGSLSGQFQRDLCLPPKSRLR